MSDERVTLGRMGLDEIMLNDVDVHIERMDKGMIWLSLTRRGKPDERLSVLFTAHGNALRARVAENDLQITDGLSF